LRNTGDVRPIGMFSLSFDSSHGVLLAQFAGVLSSEDINGLDKALAVRLSPWLRTRDCRFQLD
jgi:hypothetical protein